jgi:hypothetical protein
VRCVVTGVLVGTVLGLEAVGLWVGLWVGCVVTGMLVGTALGLEVVGMRLGLVVVGMALGLEVAKLLESVWEPWKERW